MIKPSKKLMAFMLTLALFFLYGLQTASVSFSAPSNQTVPTRTPVPAPTEPPAPTKPPSNNNNNNPPAPTNTPEIIPTATTRPITLAPTPIGGIINPDRCGEPYFIATLGGVNVRSEPSTDSEIITKMVYLEARQILARAADVSWWQVLLPDTSTGWVFDSTGSMVGLMDTVPVINPDGSVAAEPFWQPTPDLFCPTPEPSPTPTVTETPVPTEIPSATPVATNTPEPLPTATVEAVIDSETGDSDGQVVAEANPDLISPLPDTEESAEIERSKRPAPEPIQAEADTGLSSPATPAAAGFNWPILIGAALILFGFGALMFQRRQDSASS
ncbi:MAG: SH3 domain-containing protein [Anaerolineae bacterium]